MHLPFTVEQFLGIFVAYNTAIWPAQVFLNLLALLALGLCFRSHPPSRLIALILVLLWLWTGIIYHLVFFSTINPAAWFFGGLCIAAACTFLYAGVLQRTLKFGVERDWRTLLGGLIMVYGLVLYPLIGLLLGHRYPASPTFGAPCPTTIFTFGLLLWTRTRVKWYLFLAPLLWSLIGSMAAVKLGIREDLGLLVAGIAGAVILLMPDHARITNPSK